MYEIPGYDEWKLDTPDNHVKSVGKCSYCGLPVYDVEKKLVLLEGTYHMDCWWEKEDEECRR